MTRPRASWTPPHRNGVGPSRVAVPAGPWPTLEDFLAQRLPAVADWPQRIARGDVLHADGQAVRPGEAPRAGLCLWYWRWLDDEQPPADAAHDPLTVLHRCDQLLVVDKPHHMAATPGGRHLQHTALVQAKRLSGIDTLVPMHRLDLETAGVLVFIVQPAHRAAYLALLRERAAHKVYEAVAPRTPALEAAVPSDRDPDPAIDADRRGTVTLAHHLREPPGHDFMQMRLHPELPPNCETRVRKLRDLPDGLCWPDGGPARDDARPLALYRLQPLTGRKHQLRAQLNAVGAPIVGDRIYPRLWPPTPAGSALDHRRPLQLLARSLGFVDPVNGQLRYFESRRQLLLAAAAHRLPAAAGSEPGGEAGRSP